MLSFIDPTLRGSRRSFLQAGSLALGGLTLPGLLAQQAMAWAAAGRPAVRDRSVIFLFLHGGPSQFETFDPKMSAPEGIRSTTGEIKTALPGVTFGSTFPKLAALADQLSIVRSFTTGDANHDIKPIVAKPFLNANLGSLYARVAGTTNPRTGMPATAALFPQSVDATTGPAQAGFGRFTSAGTLGPAYEPFVPGGGGHFQKDLQLSIPKDRIDDRRSLLSGLDRIRRAVDQGSLEGVDKFQDQAFHSIIGGVSEAFDLKKEDPKVLERYDTAPLVRADQISRKWNNYNHYLDNAKSLGKLLLLARRLCEAGCGFVTVTTNFVWDMHADSNNAPCEEGMQYMGRPLDHALSAFLDDVRSRGLSDKILLVTCGEMGRTPQVNKNGGRDHWGELAPLLVAGGGLKMGQVIGQSDPRGGRPATTPNTSQNLVATLMSSLLDIGKLRTMPGVPVELLRAITAAEPIEGLV